MHTPHLLHALALTLALTLTACGGGGSKDNGWSDPPTPTTPNPPTTPPVEPPVGPPVVPPVTPPVTPPTPPASGPLQVSSVSFEDGKDIPLQHAATPQGGSNTSPSLTLGRLPEGTNAWAIIMDDETAPCGSGAQACVHWGVFNLPASKTTLGLGEDLGRISGAILGRTYNEQTGYQGPNPDTGRHTYKMTVYALKSSITSLSSTPYYTRSMFESSHQSAILDQVTWTGYFSSQKPPPPDTLEINSASYANGTLMPLRLAGLGAGGRNLSPQLSVLRLPAQAASLSIIMDDETAPCGSGPNACVHWGVFNLPTWKTSIDEGEALDRSAAALLGQAYDGTVGYRGPNPPASHIYKMTVYALSEPQLPLAPVPRYTRSQFEAAFAHQIIDRAHWTGVFTPSLGTPVPVAP